MSKYAIVETGSKQYRLEANDVIDIELLDLEQNQKEVTLEKVLLVRDGDNIKVGNPVLKGAKVICDYLGEIRAPKVISFKFRKRKASRRKKGHRQDFIRLRVKEIKAA